MSKMFVQDRRAGMSIRWPEACMCPNPAGSVATHAIKVAALHHMEWPWFMAACVFVKNCQG